jgi:hypothetical protein
MIIPDMEISSASRPVSDMMDTRQNASKTPWTDRINVVACVLVIAYPYY